MSGEFRMYEWETIKSTFASFIPDEVTMLMQYTGLKDKNGIEMYEGDILKTNKRVGAVEWKDLEACYTMTYRDGRVTVYRTLSADEGDETGYYCSWCEVIGNIYENPELLEK